MLGDVERGSVIAFLGIEISILLLLNFSRVVLDTGRRYPPTEMCSYDSSTTV